MFLVESSEQCGYVGGITNNYKYVFIRLEC